MSPTSRTQQLPKQDCEGCKKPFQPLRRNIRFCKRKACAQARQKARWTKWRESLSFEEFRDFENSRQQGYRERTGYTRNWELQNKYGITLEFWLGYLDKIEHSCEICKKQAEVLCVDHDHATGRFRGALCRSCNRSIGQLGDTAEHLRRALSYLERVNSR